MIVKINVFKLDKDFLVMEGQKGDGAALARKDLEDLTKTFILKLPDVEVRARLRQDGAGNWQIIYAASETEIINAGNITASDSQLDDSQENKLRLIKIGSSYKVEGIEFSHKAYTHKWSSVTAALFNELRAFFENPEMSYSKTNASGMP